MLKQDFVPVAIDKWYQRQQQDAEGVFYRTISNKHGTTQGFYLADANGRLLAYNNNRGPERIRRRMKETLTGFRSPMELTRFLGETDKKFDRTIPEGATVVRVRAKVLDGYPETSDPWKKIFQASISRDNLWILPDEKQQLARYEFPDSLAQRIARFHLTDNTRGEPDMWRSDEVRALRIQIGRDGRISGSFLLESRKQDRGFAGAIRGFVEFNDRHELTRIEIVARGDYWGEGRYTRGAPPGEFPLAVTFQIADGSDIADSVAPQGTKGWMQEYLKLP